MIITFKDNATLLVRRVVIKLPYVLVVVDPYKRVFIVSRESILSLSENDPPSDTSTF